MKIRSKEKGRRGIGECSKSSCCVKLCFSDSWISVLCAAILILFSHSCIVSVSGEKLHDDVQVVVTRKLAKQTLLPSVLPSLVPSAGPSLLSSPFPSAGPSFFLFEVLTSSRT